MREILFRGKNHAGWHFGSLLDCNQPEAEKMYIGKYGAKSPGLLGFEYVCIDPKTVGQFTGITDKNGKKIFEGDICDFECRIQKLNGRGIVYWNNDGMYFGAKTILPFLLHQALRIEVIGNIHENPELLDTIQQ